MSLKPSQRLLVGIILGTMATGYAAEPPISVALVAVPGSRAQAVAFAKELRHVIDDDAIGFTLAKSPLDVDVWIEIESVGRLAYRPGPGPGSRIYFGCLVLARVTTKRTLPMKIEHRDDTDCHEAARGLLLGIKGTLGSAEKLRDAL